MSFSSSWSVESKEFELRVVGGKTGVCIREYCKWKKRSILLVRDELAWLVRIWLEWKTLGYFGTNLFKGSLGFLRNVASTNMAVFWWLRNSLVTEEVIRLSPRKVKLVKVGSVVVQS
jgi:hypothetical protein